MAAKKHIIWITPGFPESETDTRCIPPLQDLAMGLSKMPEFDLTVIALHYPYAERSYHWHDIPVYACGGNNRNLIVRNKIWKRALKRMRVINEGRKADAIHSFWLSECAWLGQKISRRYNIPHINTLMGQEGKTGNIYERFVRKNNLVIVAVSPFQAKLFEKRTGRRPDHIIPWGLDTGIISVSRDAEKEIDMLGVGSLIKLKDYQAFLEVVLKLKMDFPGLKCEIFGEGPERKNLEKFVSDNGLEDNVRFHGFVSREKVLYRMAKSKVLLHPSTYESFGMVFLEALYFGLEIVSRRVGIARRTDQWQIAGSMEEMTAAVKKALQRHTAKPVLLIDRQETLNAYARIYQPVGGK